jgi:Flp pilus assembly protein TadD
MQGSIRTLFYPTETDRRWLSLVTISMMAALLSACGERLPEAPVGQITAGVGEAALSAGMPELALRVAGIVLRDHPRDAAALTTRGDALLMLDQREEARRAYAEAVALSPLALRARMDLGRVLLATDPASAEVAFLAVLASEPGNIAALNNLGIARDLGGRHEAAQGSYRDALARGADSDVQANLVRSISMSVQVMASGSADLKLEEPIQVVGPVTKIALPAPVQDAPRPAPVQAAQIKPALLVQVASRLPPVVTAQEAPVQAPVAVTSSAAHRFQVQLAALLTEAAATGELGVARQRLPDLLDGMPSTVVQAVVGGRAYWRLRVGDFAAVADARGLCERIRRRGADCWVP